MNNRNGDGMMMSARGMTRRAFMERASALGVSVAVADAMWISEARAAPSRGGTLRLGCDGGGTTNNLDPKMTSAADHESAILNAVYDTLTIPNADGSIAPGLAESWEGSADGKKFAFKLRKGVEFHNGKKLTAADVVYSINNFLQPGTRYTDGKNIASGMETIRADGNDTVIMEQKSVNHDLPIHLSAVGMVIAPEGTTNWMQPGLGTGPYVMENFEPGVRFIGKKFGGFYRDDQGWFDSVEITNIADPATRTSALLSGALDAIGNPELKTAGRLKKIPGLDLKVIPSGQHMVTLMRIDTPQFASNDLRLAIKYGIKRQEIVDKVFMGYGYVGNDHPIGRNIKFFNKDLPQREYDPERAAFHLKKSGYSGDKLELYVSEGAAIGSSAYGLLMRNTLRELGINMEVKAVPADGYFSEIWKKVPWMANYWTPRPTADFMLAAAYLSTSASNDTGFRNETFDKLHAAARAERDETKRAAMYYEMQRILNEEGGTNVFAFVSFLIGASDKLGHHDIGSTRRVDDARLARKWWFKA